MSRFSFNVCEPVALGFEHVPVNAGLLKIIRVAYPEAAIAFYAEETHLELVRAQLTPQSSNSIDWISIANPKRQTSFFRRLPTDFRRVRELFKLIDDDDTTQVVLFTFGNASVMWSLKFLTSTVHRRRKSQVVLHGDFATLRYRTSMKRMINPIYHMGSFKTAVHFGCAKGTQYLVLEEAVRDAVVAKFPRLAGRFKVIDHPVSGNREQVSKHELSSPVKFGFLGRASEAKGFSHFLAVAKHINERFPGQAVFSLVGFLGPGQDRQTLPNLVYLDGNLSHEKLEWDEYAEQVKELHFVCLFYDKEYEFAASGVLADAIGLEKPIIASALPLFANVERKFPHAIRFSADTDFAAPIEEILTSMDPASYERQVTAIRAVKQSRTPEALAVVYRNLVDEFSKD